MSYVRSFANVKPPARFDGNPWTGASIQEVDDPSTGTWSTIDTPSFTDYDTDPARPKARSLTATHAEIDPGYYRIQWIDAAGSFQYSDTFYIDDNAQNIVANLVQAEMPRTWDGLAKADWFGEILLNKKIAATKAEILPATVANTAESGWTDLLVSYVAKVAARSLIPAGIEYWMRMTTTVTATGTSETTSFTDPTAALKLLDKQLQVEIERLRANPDLVAFLSSPPELPALTDGRDTGNNMATPDPYDFDPPFLFT